MPRVSIGVPVKDGEKYLTHALESIRTQTYEDFEVLISDNASSDRTQHICEEFCCIDSRFRYVRQAENVGAAGNFNFVFHRTSGEYFRWASYDDVMHREYLANCVPALDSSEESVLVYPKTVRIDAAGEEIGTYGAASRLADSTTPWHRLAALIGPGDEDTSLIHMCFPVFGLMRRSALARTSLIANMPRSDRLLLAELALLGRFLALEAPLFLRREHDAGSVTAVEKVARGVQQERLLASWYDPNRGGRYPATISRLGLGYLRASLLYPRTSIERLRSAAIALGWIARHSRAIGGEVKILLHEQLRS